MNACITSIYFPELEFLAYETSKYAKFKEIFTYTLIFYQFVSFHFPVSEILCYLLYSTGKWKQCLKVFPIRYPTYMTCSYKATSLHNFCTPAFFMHCLCIALCKIVCRNSPTILFIKNVASSLDTTLEKSWDLSTLCYSEKARKQRDDDDGERKGK